MAGRANITFMKLGGISLNFHREKMDSSVSELGGPTMEDYCLNPARLLHSPCTVCIVSTTIGFRAIKQYNCLFFCFFASSLFGMQRTDVDTVCVVVVAATCQST